jgi:TatD DNase family protein
VEADLGIIESKLQEKNCLAWANAVRQRLKYHGLQQTVLKSKLLAQKYNKPVVIHCVAAFQEVIDTKRD